MLSYVMFMQIWVILKKSFWSLLRVPTVCWVIAEKIVIMKENGTSRVILVIISKKIKSFYRRVETDQFILRELFDLEKMAGYFIIMQDWSQKSFWGSHFWFMQCTQRRAKFAGRKRSDICEKRNWVCSWVVTEKRMRRLIKRLFAVRKRPKPSYLC